MKLSHQRQSEDGGQGLIGGGIAVADHRIIYFGLEAAAVDAKVPL